MINVEGLYAYYGNLNILKGVSFKVNPGEIVVIIGPNGAGKSTAVKSIIGILTNKKGKITFDDIDITHMETEEIIPLGLALVPKEERYFNRYP